MDHTNSNFSQVRPHLDIEDLMPDLPEKQYLVERNNETKKKLTTRNIGVSEDFNTSGMIESVKKNNDVIVATIEAIGTLLQEWVAPWLFDKEGKHLTQPIFEKDNYLPSYFIHDSFNLAELISTEWLSSDINRLSPPKLSNEKECALGIAFDQKYSRIPTDEDARSAVVNWNSEAKSALTKLGESDRNGHLLHVGCDDTFEVELFHQFYVNVTLVDIAENQLKKASTAAPYAQVNHTSAELLDGVANDSIDCYVALRVFSSAQFNKNMALQQAARVLKENGQILISSCNGYRTIDNTIIPGQVVGSPPKISLSK